ncbi:MAG: hypothetical protein IJE99_07330 [Alistipes sp.]|nr:hypothetical protein [Alistipes sp.]
MKARFLALLALVLGVVSCQTEPEGLNVNVGEVDAIINVTIPEAETRAAGSNSAAGAFANGVLGTESDNTTMRYILQVYYNGVASQERKVAYSDGKSVAFEVRLVPERNYKFVVWADVVTDGENDTDNHYDTSNLENITLLGEWNAMDESRDAFTATELIENYSGASNINITLRRPFAKLRVVTTDINNLTNLGIVPTTATVEYTTTHRVAFNAFEGKAADASESKTHSYTINPYSNETNTGAEYTLFTDYFFAENDVVKFNFNVYEDEAKTKLIKENNFVTDINVKRNHLTTIKGNILTDGKGFDVSIEDGFENGGGTNPDYEYATITSAVELLRAIGTSGNYIVMNDIRVTEADVLVASTLAATRSTTTTTTINLNGFTITIANDSNEPLVTLDEGEKVVFAGDGAIEKDPNTNGDFIDNSNDNTEVVFAGADYDEEVFTENVTDYANDFINAFNTETGYTLLADIIVKQSLTLPEGKSFELDLNGKTLSAINSISDKNNDGQLTSADNVVFIDVRGNLTVKNGTMTLKHTGDNYGWNACTELFYVGFNGTLNLNGVHAENLGGSDMAYVVDMVNATNITVNVANSTLKSTYIPFRVFNNGSGMNNVTINNSTLEGVSRAFWVHIYSNADNGGKGVKSSTLNLDIFGNGNTFIASNPNRIIEFGYTDEINFNAEGEQIVYSAARLKSIANYANSGYSFKGETIKLAADIDLNNENWTAIGTPEANFCGTFDGCDYTIKNLKILVTEGKEDKAYLGLFGYAKDATIKNVVFENVDINVACLDIDHSQGHIGAVAGSLEGTSTIENVTVKGDVKVEATFDANGASRVAVVAGGNSYGNVTMKSVHVVANEGSYLKANNNVGALAGQLQGKSVFENCSSNIDVTGKKFFAGGIIGLAAGDQTFTNCHTTGDITITQGREGRAHDHFRVGGIAGGWADNVKTPLVITNCSYTGKVSGKDFNGNEANPLDYAGYVGRGYTLASAGTTVNIDGTLYVQKYDGADNAGVYDVTDAEGNVVVSTFAELEAAAKAGGNIALGADIEFTKNIAVTNANFTLNGKGHKITQAESFNNPIALIDITYGKIGLKNVKFDGIKTGAVLRTVYAELKADNVTVENCEHTVDQGLIRLLGSSEITNSTFKNNICKMLISYNYDDSKPEFTLLLENNVIENNTCSQVGVVYYAGGGGATIKNNKFIGNTTNITTNGATLYMGFTENNVITGNLFQNNKLTTTSTAKRVGGALHIGYQCELTGNAFIGNTVSAPVSKGNDVCASVYYTDIDLSGNYWGGGAPVENDDYFVEYTNYKVIVNDYLTENPIK